MDIALRKACSGRFVRPSAAHAARGALRLAAMVLATTVAVVPTESSAQGVPVIGQEDPAAIAAPPVAGPSRFPTVALPAATLLTRWRHLPPVDARQLRADLDGVLDASL